MGKEKRKKSESGDVSLDAGNDVSLPLEEAKVSYSDKCKHVSPISQPLMSKKLAKKLYKVIRKAAQAKQLRRGVREVQKFVRKGETGIVVFAGDTFPIDVICHMPLVCEEKKIPYGYVPCKEDLGAACGSKRPTCMLLIKKNEAYEDSWIECYNEIKSLPSPLIENNT